MPQTKPNPNRGQEQFMIPQIYEILIKDDGQDIAEYAVMLAAFW